MAGDIREKVEDYEKGMEGLKEKLCDDMQSTLSQVVVVLTKWNEDLEAIVVALWSEMKELKGKALHLYSCSGQ